jgi:hypothetical protein
MLIVSTVAGMVQRRMLGLGPSLLVNVMGIGKIAAVGVY